MNRATRTIGTVSLILGTLTLVLAAHVAATDGASLYKAKSCHTCHGENGSHPIAPGYPVIAGQNAKYLLRQMIDIRDGSRTNGLSSTMKAVVASVTDQEFSVIAEWLTEKY